MSQLPKSADVSLIFIGDRNDSVVNTERAPSGIELSTQKSLDGTIYMTYDDMLLSAHAGLWWAQYVEQHTRPVIDAVRIAQKSLGFRSKEPERTEGLPRGASRPA